MSRPRGRATAVSGTDPDPARHAPRAAPGERGADRSFAAFDRITHRQIRRGVLVTSVIATAFAAIAAILHVVLQRDPVAAAYAVAAVAFYAGVHAAARLVPDRWLAWLAGGYGLSGVVSVLGAVAIETPDAAGYLAGLAGPIPVAMALFVPWRRTAHLAFLAAGGTIIAAAALFAPEGSTVAMQRPALLGGFALGAAFSYFGHDAVATIRRRILSQAREAHRQRRELVAARHRSVDALARLQALEAIGRRLADEGPTPAALDAVMGLLVDVFGYTYPSIYIGDGRRVRLGAQRGYAHPIEEFDATIGVTGRALRTRQAQLVVDVTTDPDYVEAQPDVRSEIQVPLIAEGRILGVLNVESRVALDEADLASIQVIADRVAAAMVLASHRQELIEAQRMESIGRLAGGIAHDFNNLLTVINGYATFLHETLPDDARAARSDVSEVRRAVDRAAELTRQLLGFARRSVLEPNDVELNGIVRGVEPMLRRLIGERVRLVVDLAEDAGWVRVDEALLGQVVVNLVVNARDAMPDGGTLTITTGAHALRDIDPTLTLKASDHVAILAVSDTGSGIAPEVREHIFEPFVTTKPVGQGTGLGLATTYGIVTQSGGAISFTSEPGRGTTFEVFLPQVPAGRVRHVEPLAALPAADERGTILLVEDEPAVRELTRRVLERAGYRVHAAPGSEAAIAFARDDPSPIDVLVSDVVMPGRTGPDLYRELITFRPGLPVLFMSGYPGMDPGETGLHQDGAAFIGKPFAPDELTGAVRALLRSVG